MARKNEEGFALMAVIFALVVIAILATAGLFAGSQEIRVASAGENADQALYVAENGVTQVLADWDPISRDSMAIWEADTVHGSITDEGAWKVEVLRLSERVYFVRGRGSVYRGGNLQSHVGRSVGITAARPSIELEPPSALTTRGPTEVRGTAEVHGEDQVPPGWSDECMAHPLEDKPGILSDDASNVTTSGSGEITGSPSVDEDPTIADSTFTQYGEMDWEELTDMATVEVSGTLNTIEPDSTVDGNCIKSTELNWGNPLDPDAACGDYYPIIHAQGDYLELQGGGVGQGILLVDGDLDLRGDFLFHGIVIVQGNFETQGSGNRVRGAVMAGNTYFEDQTMTGGSVVGYSGCAVTRAIEMNEALQRPQPLPMRSWSDLSRAGP